MDDWHRKLVKELGKETVAGFVPDSAAALEIAFGKARSALAYALELARAHRIPATGNVAASTIGIRTIVILSPTVQHQGIRSPFQI